MKTKEYRFLSKIKKGSPEECWEWLGARSKTGYGMTMTHREISVLAHRVAFTLFKSSIPKDLCVCHICDNPSCVNPAHLFLGTMKDNIHDMIDKGRKKVGKRLYFNDEKHPASKLTNKQIELIRNKIKTTKELAKDFNVSERTIMRVLQGITYKDVK